MFGLGTGKAKSSPRAAAKAQLMRVRASAGKITDNNRRHWANADSLSADAHASAEKRQLLRNNSRYECANNSIASGIVKSIGDYTIGTGPRLQLLGDEEAANSRVERLFAAWAKEINLGAKLRTMRKTRARDGEVFLLLAQNPRLRGPVKLDIRQIEADQVTSPTLALDEKVDGIEFDTFGNPIAYHVLKSHPGDTNNFTLGLEYNRMPADSVIHYFHADRPGQSRGLPEIMPALPLFAQLRRYTLAVLDAAEFAANLAGVLSTGAPEVTSEGEQAYEAFDEIKIERNTFMVLPEGCDMKQLVAEQPATTYADFKREVISEIARCLGMPYNIAAGDSSRHNYASGRLDHQAWFEAIGIEQDFIAVEVLDRILYAWLDEAVLIEGLLPQSMRNLGADIDHEWFWNGHEHVDPVKAANGVKIELDTGTTTLARECARAGHYWKDTIRQRAKERAALEEAGLRNAV